MLSFLEISLVLSTLLVISKLFTIGLTMVLDWSIWFWGVLCMVIGAFPMIIAYPAYNFYMEKGKAKYGQEIIELSEKLLK